MTAAEWMGIVQSLALSAGGFAIGYVTGRYTRARYDRVAAVEAGETELPDRRSGEDRRTGDRRKHYSSGVDKMNLAFGILLIVLAVASVITASIAVTRQTALTECQARYNVAFASALTERTEAATQDREAFATVTDAMERVIATVASSSTNPPGTAEERRALEAEFIGALDNYLMVTEKYENQLERSERRRNANPLPPTPTEVCG